MQHLPVAVRGIALAALLACAAGAAAGDAPRRATPLSGHWQFVQDDALTDAAAVAADGAGWQSVALPHTWNRIDAASTAQTGPDSQPYKRGRGWYRLEFERPALPANA
nr:hypothetical protein [Massilia sp. JS1662]